MTAAEGFLDKARTWLQSISYSRAVWMGLVGSIVLTITSHSVGAVRARGGIMQVIGLSSFTFGHAAGMVTVVMWCALLAMVLSWIVVGRHILVHDQPLRRSAIAAWIAPLTLAGPLMSRDIYSYLMQGTLARDGFNAYEVGAAANPGPLLFEVSADWRNTTTPYGPLHMGLGKAITSVTGDNITAGIFAFKLVSIASVLVMAWAVAQLARHMGIRPDVAVWLGVFNPLSVLHLVGGMHTENLMMALVLLGCLSAMKLRPVPGGLAAAALIGVAAALKATAFIALPFTVWIMVARVAGALPYRADKSRWRNLADTWRRFGTLVWTGLLSVAACLGVLALVTVVTNQTWGWVTEVTGNSKVINPLALPSFVASTLEPLLSRINDSLTFNVLVDAIRPVSSALMLLGLVITWWLFRHDERTAFAGMAIAYAITCVFNTVTLPWYYTAPLALVVLASQSRLVVYLTSVFCMWITFMFDGGGNNRLYALWWVLAFAVIFAWVAQACLDFPDRSQQVGKKNSKHTSNLAGDPATESPSPALDASPRGQDARAEHPLADQEESHPR
ncbi:alpha-(1-_6)-mannopyranosyltransferase A [uncultured Corynebacterium sp.]|uniref:alpha-(1->6)-mannopyranosyltransferase A n=1 Tax=uncultured Corynebacterium sp. TaxID=159447 RepID=UPI0025FC1752|nr:alpha-(1->6)-mannopyranosyltransferase A [uncultured Corynebacterium sp.]